MCGYLFYKDFHGQISDGKKKKLRHLSKALAHRGPDNHQEYSDNETFISFYRLSVIDPTDSANQPLANSDSVMAFNGMIYNYKKLKKQYKLTNVDSSSDTKVLFQLLNKLGPKVLSEIDGMASIVFNKKKTIYLFRDLFGQKPLYYFYDQSKLIACSELKVIVKLLTEKEKEIDVENINLFLTLSYLPGNKTIYKKISKVLPGELIEFSKGKITKKLIDKKSEYVNKEMVPIEKQFELAASDVAHSDVNSAMLLSGGIDSSLSFYYLRKKIKGLGAYYLSVDDKDINEDNKIEDLEKFFDIKINKIKFMKEDFVLTLKELAKKIDEPHGDIGTITSYFLMKHTGKAEKVIYTGDGADELFCGYETFKALSIPEYFKKILGNKYIEKIISSKNKNYMSLSFKFNQYVKGLKYSNVDRYFKWTSGNYENYYGEVIQNFKFSDAQNGSQLKSLRSFYMNYFLPEFICSHTDKSSMLNSKELRSIFLNKSFLSYSNTLDDKMLVNRFKTKIILKDHAKKIGLPKSVYAAKKIGFTLPISKWLCENEKFLVDFVEGNSRIFNYVDRKIVRNIFSDFIVKGINNYREIINILSLGLYLDEN